MHQKISIDNLIEIIKTGGKVQTGVDIYNDKGILLLDKDVVVEKIKILEIIKKSGVNWVPLNTALNGNLWDSSGDLINVSLDSLTNVEKRDDKKTATFPDYAPNELEKRFHEIEEIKQEASQLFNKAKETAKQVLTDIKDSGGEFNFNEVQDIVEELVEFLIEKDNPFSLLTQEILSYDDYLYNHCIHVCTIGTAIVNRFNTHFSDVVDDLLNGNSSYGSSSNNNSYGNNSSNNNSSNNNSSGMDSSFKKKNNKKHSSYICYYNEDLFDISLGFFLHDIGKIFVPNEILNQKRKLTNKEFQEAQKHSYEYGAKIIDKNKLENSIIKNIIKYHHTPLYAGEPRCYPNDKPHTQIPLYTRICKLADIYDAMTSKRCYKEAVNPITVITQLLRGYAKKDQMLQYILHSFVKSIGIYPPGSIVYLRNGQMAFVLESTGPLVLPFTDRQENTLKNRPNPVNIGAPEVKKEQMVNIKRHVKRPKDVYETMPSFIKQII